jgi:hypothetical protein
MTQASQAPVRDRARIAERTLRKDPWWRQPAINATALAVVVIYLTWASLVNGDYFWKPYISPLYSPCLADTCKPGAGFDWIPWLAWLSPAIIIIGGPTGFRLTCYYYRKAYYRAFWRAPAACAVREPHAKYTGETRVPLILQNLHRYFWYMALLIAILLSYDVAQAFRGPDGNFGFGIGSLIMLANVILLWGYTLGCHSCRHITGGRLKNFSSHPVRYWAWTKVSWLNVRHLQFAWITLGTLMLTDLYIMLVASGAFADPRIFN